MQRQSLVVTVMLAKMDRLEFNARKTAKVVRYTRGLCRKRKKSYAKPRYRASGLNLVTAAIVLWNTVYLERATAALQAHGQEMDIALLRYLSPLGWEHINLTGDYVWRSRAKIGVGKFRPLRLRSGA